MLLQGGGGLGQGAVAVVVMVNMPTSQRSLNGRGDIDMKPLFSCGFDAQAAAQQRKPAPDSEGGRGAVTRLGWGGPVRTH